jgi:hypothetical protein
MPAAIPSVPDNFAYLILIDFNNGKTYKVMLTNHVILPGTHFNISDLTEISAGNGYSAGGPSVTVTAEQSGANAFLKATQPTIAASGGTIGPYTGIALYETATGKIIGIANEVLPTIIPNSTSKTIEYNQDNGFIFIGALVP